MQNNRTLGILCFGMEFCNSGDHDSDLRRGPWTSDEDKLLIRYISCHGEGRWNLLAKRAGLKRTGKSCRLRWLNYLKPDIKRGNLTTEEQLLILKLHHKWGNRWSRIAQYLPGRTDNEIKNYWRTRVQKQARQLNIQSNSKMYLDTVCSNWIPRLLPTMEQDSTLQQMRTHPSITAMNNLADTMALSSDTTISAESLSTGLTSSSSEGSNPHNYGVDPLELGTGSDGNNCLYQQDFNESYLDEFDVGYYYNADEFSAMLALGACDTSPSGFQLDGAADGFWGVDVGDDIWQLRNSDNLGF